MQKKIKEILLIGSYNPDRIRTGQYLSPPLGIYRIASHLEKKALAAKLPQTQLNAQEGK